MKKITMSLTILLLGFGCALWGQSGLGSITGTVVDPSGAVIPGAAVELKDTSTQGIRPTTANEAGIFALPSITPGRYVIRIASSGFKEKTLENLTVNAFQQIALGQIILEVGQGEQVTVTVTAEQQLVKDSAVRYDTVQAKMVQDMPLFGRNWSGLLKAVPGGNPTASSGFNGREYGYYGYNDFSINGKNSTQTAVNLDGGGIVDHGSDGKTTVAPSLESIQEVALLTNNFQAEYGTRAGVVINVITKSGTNQFRGAIWDYMRNEALNANSWQNNYIGQKRSVYRYNYFGGNLGGPVLKNRLFFFYNYEYFKQYTPSATTFARVPTEKERNGDFSETVSATGQKPVIYLPGTAFAGRPVVVPNNILPPTLITPLGKAIMNIFPMPNRTGDVAYNYTFSSQRDAPRFSNVAKVDWNVSEKARAYFRITRDGGTATDRGIWQSSAPLPFNIIMQPRPDTAVTGNLTYMIKPTMVLEALMNWSKDDVRVIPANPEDVTKTKYGLSKMPVVFPVTDDILPQITTGIYPDFHFNRLPSYAIGIEWQGQATLTWTVGSHIMKFGGQYLMNDKDESQSTNNKGSYDFRASQSPFDTNYAPANILTGALASFTQTERMARVNSRVKQYLFFAQDTWKIRRDLTLDYGMRFYHLPPEYERTPDQTLDAVFLPSKWDPAKAPRFYVPDPKNPSLVIDPAYPNNPLPASAANTLRYTLVPGSGDMMNGVFALGQGGLGQAPLNGPSALLVAPRGGIAWSPFGNKETVIRAGFGWTYNFLTLTQTINPFRNGLARQVYMVQTSLDTMSGANNLQRIDARAYGVRDESKIKMPRVYDFSVGVQRELPWNIVIETSYVGNRQQHQPVIFDLNYVQLGTAWQAQYVDPRSAGYNFYGPISASNPGPPLPGSNAMDSVVMRPNRGHAALTFNPNVGVNRYDSWQTSINKRFGQGLTISSSYTLGRLISGTESVGLFQNKWKNYTGYVANTDRRHVATINYTYEFPNLADKLGWNNSFARQLLNSWQIAHMMSFFSGQDYTAGYSVQQANTTTGVDMNRVLLGTGDLAPRLQLAGDPNSGFTMDLAHQFNLSAFSLPGAGTDGTGPRNYVHGRGSFSNDINIAKQFRVHESKVLELRVSLFNAFNQVRRLGVNSSIQYKALGKTMADGFKIINTPEANASATTGDALRIYNAYRLGVGHVNITGVEPMRIIEIGMKFRF